METQGSVSSCVTSLITSFTNGLNVFKKLRKQRQRKKQKLDLESQEQLLTNSLRQGREDIKREYEKSIRTVGRPYAVGDAVAQTCLAEILLNLNAGLVGIISSFLSRDKKSEGPLDYASLTALSETSRIGACKVLRQLFRRSIRQSAIPPAMPIDASQLTKNQMVNASAMENKKRSKRSRAFSKAAKNGAPVLARVVIANSSQPPRIAKVKASERRNKSQSRFSSSSHLAASKLSAFKPTYPSPRYEKPDKRAHGTETRHPDPALPQPKTRPSASDPSLTQLPGPKTNRKSKSMSEIKPEPTTQQPQTSPLPQPPFAQTSQHLPLPRRQNKVTPTYYSVTSDQTKLGEIPIHLWAVQPDFEAMSRANREAEMNGWPVGRVQREEVGEKRKFRFFGLFRRKTA